jgi:hypothetical protein
VKTVVRVPGVKNVSDVKGMVSGDIVGVEDDQRTRKRDKPNRRCRLRMRKI